MRAFVRRSLKQVREMKAHLSQRDIRQSVPRSMNSRGKTQEHQAITTGRRQYQDAKLGKNGIRPPRSLSWVLRWHHCRSYLGTSFSQRAYLRLRCGNGSSSQSRACTDGDLTYADDLSRSCHLDNRPRQVSRYTHSNIHPPSRLLCSVFSTLYLCVCTLAECYTIRLQCPLFLKTL